MARLEIHNEEELAIVMLRAQELLAGPHDSANEKELDDIDAAIRAYEDELAFTTSLADSPVDVPPKENMG